MVMKQKATEYSYMEDVKANVLQKFPLLGVAISKLDTKPTEGAMSQIIDTAATNGKTVFFNPEYFKSLNEDQRAFIYAHEVMHVAFNHIMRSKGKQPKLWNTATDAVINQILKKEGYDIVGDGVDIPEALNHSAEEMYEKLLAKQQQSNQDSGQSQQSGSDSQDNKQDSQPSDNGSQNTGQNDEEQNKQNGENNQNTQKETQSTDNQNQAEDQQQNNNNENNAENPNKQGEQKSEAQNSQQNSDTQESDEKNSQDNQESQQANNQSSEQHSKDKNRTTSAQNQPQNTQNSDIEADLTDEQSSIRHGHGLWEKAVEDSELEEAKAKQSLFERVKGIFKPDNKQENEEIKEEENQEEDFLTKNRRLRHKQQQEIKQKISEHKKEVLDAMSQIGSDKPIQRDLGESPQVADWKKILKQNMLDPEDKWSYRRSGADNDYMARSEELEDEVKAKTEVMIDVSGSVDEELVKEFLRQLKPLLKRSAILVGCFDDEIYPFKEIKNRKDIDNFRIPGGGGTDLDLAVRSFSDDKDTNKIVFTDGCGNMPRPDLKNVKNLFWVVYKTEFSSWYYDERPSTEDWFKPICGKVIYVDRKEISQNFIRRQNKYIGR